MPKSLTLGNGNILICLDKYGQVRDFYYPYIGLENHIGGHFVHRIGVWTDGQMKWFSDLSWKVTVLCEEKTLAGNTTARNDELGLEIHFNDIVYNELNIFLRRVTVINLRESSRRIKIFFGHEFEIYESHRGDSVYFDPNNHAIVHYNGRRVFLIGGRSSGEGFNDYTTGIFNMQGKQGSYLDAEDGILSQNPVEHGPTDSVVGFTVELNSKEEKSLDYWVVAAKSISSAKELEFHLRQKTPDHIERTTKDFWSAWVDKQKFNFHDLGGDIISLFKRSLFTIRVHSDNNGAIIASGDSDMLQGGKDTYSYMWPRDGAFSAIALDMAGDANVSQRLYKFCNKVISDGGYFMHKYRPDGSLGSSWHPWIRNGKPELPIQEDETALVVYGLWKHYLFSRDIEFVEEIYNSLIKKASDFMVGFIDDKTGLPLPSYGLWEEKFGISTYTACAVYGALNAAANFANLFGKQSSSKKYLLAAEKIKKGILRYLYDEKSNTFRKLAIQKDGAWEYDSTLDMSSVYGIFAFDILPTDDPRLVKAIKDVEEKLACHTSVGGVARYEGDGYYRTDQNIPGNPWFITTLWLAQYYIKNAKTMDDMLLAKHWIQWVVDHALPSGVLSEQLNTHTGEQISAAPLTWSHAEFVITVIKYLDRLEELGLCDDCDPLYGPKK